MTEQFKNLGSRLKLQAQFKRLIEGIGLKEWL